MSDAETGRLTLVGLGLEADGVSLAGRSAARRADEVFLEAYTARAPRDADALEELANGPVRALDRAAVEEGSVLVDAARGAEACLLVPGDPLSATTHTALRLQAREAGLAVRVHHAGSVLTAVAGAVGLSHYKFGRATTLVTPREDYFPSSPYEVVEANLERGLHTLVLLDVREDGDAMTAAEGAGVLARLAAREEGGRVDEGTEVVAVARAGTASQRAWRGPISAIRELDAGEPMHSLVVPGELGPVEAEALEVSVTES